MASSVLRFSREAMCDEYDDERMRVFWRQIAMLEEHEALESEPEDTPTATPLGEVVESKRTKPRALVH